MPDSEHAEVFCRNGGTMIVASDGDIAALEQASQSVYGMLEQDAATRQLIAQLRDLEPSSTSGQADATLCPAQQVESATPAPVRRVRFPRGCVSGGDAGRVPARCRCRPSHCTWPCRHVDPGFRGRQVPRPHVPGQHIFGGWRTDHDSTRDRAGKAAGLRPARCCSAPDGRWTATNCSSSTSNPDTASNCSSRTCSVGCRSPRSADLRINRRDGRAGARPSLAYHWPGCGSSSSHRALRPDRSDRSGQSHGRGPPRRRRHR